MPRISRKSLDSTYFHIMVQGISKEDIFLLNDYKRKYIRLIYKFKEKYNVEIFAFCIMNNHAHLLLHIDKIDEMSKFMHKINCLYAMYYNKHNNNRVGHVFRNRFKSEEIRDNIYLSNCIKYIHDNPIKAHIVQEPINYKFSSYKDFYYKKGIALNTNLRELIDVDYILRQTCEEYNFIDIEKDIDSIIRYVKNNFKLDEMTKEDKYKAIENLKNEYGIPYNKSCLEFKINERTFRRKMSVLTNVPKTDKEVLYDV